jgi:3-deoxy-manno-octulosonate cytidylyltransferase (CMP-KDO synthetase)
MMRAICVIPARMASSRYPGKPLKPLLGLPLILHVYRRCRLYAGFERVVIATCDEEIRAAAVADGAEAVMTKPTHERATDRTEEAIAKLDLGLADDDLALMVQGDEILMTPQMAGAVVSAFEKTRPSVVNLASRIYRPEDHDDPNVVKVVVAPDGRALYFSRAPIPSRARMKELVAHQQTGVIGFSAAFLQRYSKLPPTPLEQAESCDMLRVLEHGLPIQIVTTDAETIGVDTPADHARAEKILAADPLTRRYLERAA